MRRKVACRMLSLGLCARALAVITVAHGQLDVTSAATMAQAPPVPRVANALPTGCQPSLSLYGTPAIGSINSSISSAGDVDGDGFVDLIVNSGGSCSGGGLVMPARVLLFRGTPGGFEAAPAWTASESDCASIGDTHVAGGGDLNGDGYDDIAIGWSHDSHYLDAAGRVDVYLGGPGGLHGSASWSRYGTLAKATLGGMVQIAPDVNRDGFDDLLVSAPSGFQPAKVFLYLGGPSGLPAEPAWTATAAVLSQEGLGTSLASGADVNGDGYRDVVVGEPAWFDGAVTEGRTYLFLGTAGGLGAQPAWVGHGPFEYGNSVALADVNGDGFGDVIVGSYGDSGGDGTYPGAVYLYLGSPAGPSVTPTWVRSLFPRERLGQPVATVGDVNGDGLADVLVGARSYPGGTVPPGRLLLFLGTRDGLMDAPAWQCAPRYGPGFPPAVAALGDVSGDGLGDFVAIGPASINPPPGQPVPDYYAAHIYFGGTTDTDGDGITDDLDSCPGLAGVEQADGDQDRVGDACDNCKLFANWDQRDADADALGDACEFAWGDVAPRGVPDGQITVADVVLILRFSVGLETPTTDELHRANVAPASTVAGPPALVTPTLVPPPGVDVSDAVMALRAAVGLVVFTAPY